MFWPGINNWGVWPEGGRPWSQAFLCCLALAVVLLPVESAWAFPAITVDDLRTVGPSPEIMVAQVQVAEVPRDQDDPTPEEIAVFAPGERFPGAGSEGESRAISGTAKELPRVAIIIDDMGYHHQLGADLLALEMNLTFSFLPHAPFSREQAEQAWQQGHDILVHMPMEARDTREDPGPGTLYLADSLELLAGKVAQNLASVPHAVGINNHMGSRYTEDRSGMHQFFKLLAGQDMLFVDSLTSSASLAMETARLMGFKAARRDVFLDNVQTQEGICRQLELLVKEASTRGWAIGIGHPNEATVTALAGCQGLLLSQVRLVGIRELVR